MLICACRAVKTVSVAKTLLFKLYVLALSVVATVSSSVCDHYTRYDVLFWGREAQSREPLMKRVVRCHCEHSVTLIFSYTDTNELF